MPRAIRYCLTGTALAAVLAWAVLPGARPGVASAISRVDLAGVAVLLTALPALARRRFGPMRADRRALLLRVAGYLAVIALVLAKAQIEQIDLSRLSAAALAGVWAGAATFLTVVGVYTLGLLAVTAARPPVAPAALAVGMGAGMALGLVVFGLRMLVNYVELDNGWVGLLSGVLTVMTVLLVLYTAVRAGIAAARRAPDRGIAVPLAEQRARQAVAAGLCVGIAAALVVALLGTATIALAPHAASSIQWTLPGNLLAPGRGPTMTPGAIPAFEATFSQAAAGYLLVLMIFPVLGAGLGAWGGLIAIRPGPASDGGWGGGGPGDPDPGPFGPDGGRFAWDELEEFPELARPAHDRIPAGAL